MANNNNNNNNNSNSNNYSNNSNNNNNNKHSIKNTLSKFSPKHWAKRTQKLSIGLAIVSLVFIIYFLVVVSNDYTKYKDTNPYLVLGTKIAKTQMIIPGHKIQRSVDGKYGLEFSYTVWLYVEDSNFVGARGTEYKHVFHKGSKDGSPLGAPNMWLDKDINRLNINMNTYHSLKESCSIDNIPLNKWFHVSVVVVNKSISVYVNCKLKKKCNLIGVPKLNYGDVYINMYNGFDGFVSQLRYWNKAISQFELEGICDAGPSKTPCTQPGAVPPYLSKTYWMKTDFPNAIGLNNN